MTEFEIVELQPQPSAVLSAELPMAELPAFFDRAFHTVMAAIGAQGVDVAGPPFGYYPRKPGELVAVCAGFPTSRPVEEMNEVVPLVLPAGPAIQGVHVGTYDRLYETYAELMAWVEEHGVTPGDAMWECYLSDPSAEPDPSTWRTLIVWPLA